MGDIQRVLEKLLNLLYTGKIGIDSVPVNELKKVISSKLNIIQENTGNLAADEFESTINIFLKSQNIEGIIHLLAFLILLFKKTDYMQKETDCLEKKTESLEKEIESLQKEIESIKRWTSAQISSSEKEVENAKKWVQSRLSEKNPLKYYSIRYGIKNMYENTYYSTRDHAFKGKGCVYCVITGGYDQLESPQFINPELDYICFTDNKKLISNIWNIKQINEYFDVGGLDKVRTARYVKIVGYQLLKDYDYSIYIDGKLRITGNMLDYIEKYAKTSSLLCCPHYAVRSVYEEAPELVKQRADDIELIENQIKKYRDEGLPPTYQQIDSTCLVRSHADRELDDVMKLWWTEVKNGSKRDQLSFTYACWKKEFVYDISDVLSVNNNYFYCTSHK